MVATRAKYTSVFEGFVLKPPDGDPDDPEVNDLMTSHNVGVFDGVASPPMALGVIAAHGGLTGHTAA